VPSIVTVMAVRSAVDAAALLRSAGLRATGSRLAVLRVLDVRHHVTAEEVADAVAEQGIVLSTVYRTLEHLERVGVVRQVDLTPNRRSYHLVSTTEHLHLRCTECGQISEADAVLLTGAAAKIEQATGFVVDTRHPVLAGRCRRCQS